MTQEVPPTAPFFQEALWERALSGDSSVTADLLPILSTDINWFRIVHYVWSDELKTVTQHHLEALKDDTPTDFSGGWSNAHYELSAMLTQIPAKDAEELLDRNWSHLGYAPLFIQAALYVGTEKCLRLTEASIYRCPEDIDVFRTFFMMYIRPKTIQHLDNLKPYLYRFDEYALRNCAEVCQKLGPEGVEWSRKHLFDLLDENHRRVYHPNDADLIQDLDAISTVGIQRWLDGFRERHDHRDPLEIVKRWFEAHPDYNKLEIVARCLQFMGTRKDLSILDAYQEHSRDSYFVTQVRESTEFVVRRSSLI
jgi:hypothetical protein